MTPRNLEIAIVGAGMSGMAMGIQLMKKGIRSFTIYEKAETVGGTWRENRYPGLTCDVPSYFYSYSFEPNLDWSHRFSPGSEIQAYFERVAEKYELLPHIEFGEEITSARYDEDSADWSLETRSGRRVRADVFIMACGPLHQKSYPELEGLERCVGAAVHPAVWQHDVELEGKRIGVMGTGSTAVQMMEPLSQVASELTMFQRTAQWIVPVGNKAYTDEQRRRKHRFPILARLTRAYYQYTFESFSAAVVVPGAKRRAVAKQCRNYLASVKDEALRAKLTPDYEPMCKRLIISNTFYPTLRKDHVHLVTEGIDHVEPAGIVTRDGHLHELDVLVMATGFDAHAWGVGEVVGQGGVSLEKAWSNGTRAYRSIGLPGFPNFFMLVGPNSPIGNISLIDVSETQARYIFRCIKLLQEGRARSIAPNADATRAFHETLLAAMENTVWVTGCNSWYLDADGVPITWPWTSKRFHRDLRRPRFGDFDLQTA